MLNFVFLTTSISTTSGLSMNIFCTGDKSTMQRGFFQKYCRQFIAHPKVSGLTV